MEQDFSFVFDAMQKYRKDGAIGFIQWVTKSNYIPDPFQREEDGKMMWAKYEKNEWGNPINSEQLYEEYIKQKYKKEFVPKNVPKVKNPDGTDHVQWG